MVRRVVTGNDAQGKSFVVIDGETPHQWDLGAAVMDTVWVDDARRPAPSPDNGYDNDYDPVADGHVGMAPPPGGSVVRISTLYPPDRADPPSPEALQDARSHIDVGDHLESKHLPAMHTTPTIDYGIVLEGEVGLELDAGEVILRAGDIVVQRATRHIWHPRGGTTARLFFVMISSPPYTTVRH